MCSIAMTISVYMIVVGADNAFDAFLHAVFYIGKGKRSRPYEHFKEAMTQTAEDGNCKVCGRFSCLGLRPSRGLA